MVFLQSIVFNRRMNMEEVKKVSPLKGRKLGPRKKPSPLKGRKLGPRKSKVVLPLGLFNVAQKAAREYIAVAGGGTQAPDSVDKLLAERGKSYGSFASLAKTAQEFKSLLYRELGSRNKRLADDQAEALEMIIHKIARIINGNADIADHYLDIAGYAKLVGERLQGRSL
jgi:hypothetical protein